MFRINLWHGQCWYVGAFVDHDGAFELDDDFAVLVEAGGFDLDDAAFGMRFRFAFCQHFAAGVDGVAVEDGGGQAHFVPAEVDGVLGEVGDGEAGDEGEGEG